MDIVCVCHILMHAPDSSFICEAINNSRSFTNKYWCCDCLTCSTEKKNKCIDYIVHIIAIGRDSVLMFVPYPAEETIRSILYNLMENFRAFSMFFLRNDPSMHRIQTYRVSRENCIHKHQNVCIFLFFSLSCYCQIKWLDVVYPHKAYFGTFMSTKKQKKRMKRGTKSESVN